MDYKQALMAEIDSYYSEVIEKYKVTTTVAMKAGKKLSLFKKRDFSKYIQGFQNHMEDAKEYLTTNVDIPDNDFDGKELAEKLQQSAKSFCHLCKSSMGFYEITDKKQYKYSGIHMDDYKLAYNVMQESLVDAIGDLDALDKAYRKYAPEKFPEDTDKD